MTISGSTRFDIPSEVVARDVAGEIMILHLGSAIYFGLNEVGSRVWQLLGDRQPIDAVCATLAQEFDAPADRIQEDVVALTTTLVGKGLLSVVG